MATQESSNTANLAGEAPDDNLVDTESVDNNKTVTEKAYNELGNTVKGLVILCRGLKKDNGDLLIDIDSEEPWKGVGRCHDINDINLHIVGMMSSDVTYL